MAESEGGRIGLGSGIDRIGDPQDRLVSDPALHDLNVRHDGTFNPPMPGWTTPPTLPSAQDALAAQEPPTEAGNRQRLAECLQSRKAALEALERAQEAHLRGLDRVARCQKAAAALAGLDQAATVAVLDQVRAGEQGGLPPEVRDAVAEREAARIELAAATEAEAVLLREHGAATEAYRGADDAQKAAVGALILMAKEQLRPEIDRLKQRAGRLNRAFVTAQQGEPWPAPWRELAERPLADPEADLTVEVSDAEEPIPEPPPPPVPPRVVAPDPAMAAAIMEANRQGEVEVPLAIREWHARQAAARGPVKVA
jgi:hypothetical protein